MRARARQSSAAAQRQLNSITAATAGNVSPPPRSAPLSKAEQEDSKLWGRFVLIADAEVSQCANVWHFKTCVNAM